MLNFLQGLQANLTTLSRQTNLAAWAYNVNITEQTMKQSAMSCFFHHNNDRFLVLCLCRAVLAVQAVQSQFVTEALVQAAPFFASSSQYSADTQRKLLLLKCVCYFSSLIVDFICFSFCFRLMGGMPKNAAQRSELETLVSSMEGNYSAATVCPRMFAVSKCFVFCADVLLFLPSKIASGRKRVRAFGS